jgi:hypothetical protein
VRYALCARDHGAPLSRLARGCIVCTWLYFCAQICERASAPPPKNVTTKTGGILRGTLLGELETFPPAGTPTLGPLRPLASPAGF